ncbi:relaxase/mobilization nuclease domain-containing protein [Laspinema olomoucense]|uniref:relaxase/mobilization nuclease domain-containing protein n=1 Tax=Laspinema olomoucense TaxID=3231600 RepID=UPI0021BAE49F|nr:MULTISPECIES: relaxase/mobilization nuclease domain-containing protein [unclassified Laspinema]MCT7975822.1 relaxase/mobilization nuclease domain-containing protein [Laspinema sp. D3d]MCT7996561.1 relaxase/mobilization nuclease domain-containing protein [Laspinema sp. D3c]
MIGKVTKGNNFTGLLSYVLDKPGAKYIGASQLSGEQSHQWAAQFMRIAAKRRRTEYPVAHYSFSPPPNQPMADETAYRYAQKFCQRMGHENCQWLLVRHTDTKTENGEDRDHFHLVVNRVTIDGTRTVSSFNDWYRSQAAHRALSEEFELERVPSVWETDRRNPSTGQIRRVRRQNREYAEGKRSTPADPIILTELQDRIDKFCQDRPELIDLVERLLSSGVNVRIQPASNGGLGISYQLGSVAVAGSSLGRAYTVKGLQQRRGVSYQPVYDNPILKLYLKDQWYEWPYVDKNRNRPRIRQKPTSPEPTPGARQEPAQKSKSNARELSAKPLQPNQSARQEHPQKPKSTQPELSPALKKSRVQSKPDLLGEEEYRQWSEEVAPVLNAYIQHQGVPIVEGCRFRTYKHGQDLVLEYRNGSRTLMIAHNTDSGSWETRNYFPVERSIAEYILSESLPAMQQDMRPPYAWFSLRAWGPQLSQVDVLNGQEYQQWVNQVAPVLDAYLKHHDISILKGDHFRTYKRGQELFLEDLENSALLMIAHKTESGSWKPRNCLPLNRTIAQDILSESIPAMQRQMKLHLEDTSRQSSSKTLTPKPSKSPYSTPTPTPTQDPPDILNEQEYQQWVNTVAPFLNTYLKHRGGRMVEGERFRTYKRGQYLVLEYQDGSSTLILGRPTGNGSWETPQQFSVSVKREDANYILERSIPLMQRRMSQDKERAQNKQRSRSGQLDISD